MSGTQTPVTRVGFVVHGGRPKAVEAARAAAALMAERSIRVVQLAGDADETDLGDQVIGTDRAGFVDGTDCVLSFGGDGTFLRAAHRCRDAGVPVLGVNLGRVGFLAELEVDMLEAAADLLAAGAYSLEDRATIEAVLYGPDGRELDRAWALNDVSIEKTARQRLLLMEVHLAGEHFASVPADAMVLATATGSTAYALSAGGPIISPTIAATLVTPVAPHSLFDRTVVCAPDEVVRVDVVADQEPAVLSVDGRDPLALPAGGSVEATGNGRPVRLMRLFPPHFYGLVRRKFSLR